MKKLWKATALALGLTLAALLPAAAQQGRAWMQARRGNMITQHLVRELNLSSTQRAQIKTILTHEQPAIQQMVANAEQANTQLRSKSTFDEAFVRGVAAQQVQNMTDALVEREKIRAEIMAVLDPSQQQTFNQMTSELRAAFEHHLSSLGNQL